MKKNRLGFFLLFLSFLFTLFSCSNKYVNKKFKYSIPISSEWNIYQKNLDDDLSEYVSKFINPEKTDVVFYNNVNRINPALITVVSYPRYINISKINEDSRIEEDFLNEIIYKFGNGKLVNKGIYSHQRVKIAFFDFTFFFDGVDYTYQINFLSGSIASTQSIYFLAKENEKDAIESDLDKIIKGYRKF